MKVVYVVDSLFNSAGMERVLTMKANALSLTFDVTFIVKDQMGKQPFFPLLPDIRIIDCACQSKKEYRNKVDELLRKEHFDIAVSTGGLEFYFLTNIRDGSKKVFEFHFSYDVSAVWMAGVKNPIVRWIMIRAQTLRRLYFANKYNQVVVLSHRDQKKWRRYIKNVKVIPNPLTIQNTEVSTCENKQVIAVGRLDYQKGFDLLIEAWAKVYETHHDWILNIYGEGFLYTPLQNKIDDLHLSQVVFLKGRTNDIASKYIESSMFVLSSRTEAFGLVIVEAESCGLPIVAMPCSGINEIMENGKNGYIINQIGNVEEMAKRICDLIEDESLRKRMGRHSVECSHQFSMENIMKLWIDLFNFL